MRIEAYTQVQQMYSTKKTEGTKSPAKASFSDAVQISSLGKDIQTAKAAVANSSVIREELTGPFKAGLNSGYYDVSDDCFATKLFEKYNSAL